MTLNYFLCMKFCWMLGNCSNNREHGSEASFVHPLGSRPVAFRKEQQNPTVLFGSPFSSSPRDKPRKEKVNKYRKNNTEGATHTDKDPFDLLMEESERKLLELNKQKLSSTKQRKFRNSQEVDLEKIQELYAEPRNFAFPDNKDINPNEPSSFGFIEIATVLGPHGVHGEIKVKSSSDFPRRFTDPGIKYFKPQNKRAPRKVVLVYGKQSKDDEYILQFDGINTREDAKRYQKGTLFVREEEREKGTAPEKDQKLDTETENTGTGTGTIENQSTKKEEQEEFFISDLVGLEVFLESEDDTGNPFVGTVAGIVLAQEMCAIPGLGHDMLELNLPRGKGGTVSLRDELVLIPFVPPIVPRVSIADKKIFISPPAGLLDLTYVREEKVRIKGFLPPAE